MNVSAFGFIRLRLRPRTIASIIRLPAAPIASLIIRAPPRLGRAPPAKRYYRKRVRSLSTCAATRNSIGCNECNASKRRHLLLFRIVDGSEFYDLETPFSGRSGDLDFITFAFAHQAPPDG